MERRNWLAEDNDTISAGNAPINVMPHLDYRPLNSHGLTVRHTVLGLSRRSWSPATTGPPGPSAANYVAIDGPPGPSMAAMNGPPCHKWSPPTDSRLQAGQVEKSQLEISTDR